MMRIGWIRTVGIGLALTLALAACSGDDDTSTPAPAATESPTGQESPTGEESPLADAATVQLAESDLGSILVDADGMTLYLFEADTDGTSTCYDDCAETWPPLVADASERSSGKCRGCSEPKSG